MSSIELRIPCSEEQCDVLFDFAIGNGELGMLPDERAWILSNVRKQYPKAKVVSADLDIPNATWVTQVTTD